MGKTKIEKQEELKQRLKAAAETAADFNEFFVNVTQGEFREEAMRNVNAVLTGCNCQTLFGFYELVKSNKTRWR